MKEKENLQKRILMSVIGVVVCGVSVGFFKRAAFGVDPYQSLMSGLDALLPIGYGTLYVIATLALLFFALFADRHYIGLATIINLLFLGYIAQFVHELLLRVFPDLSAAGRFVLLLIGIVTMCLASAFYFTADLGVSTYDAVSLIIANTWHKIEFRWCRIISDLVCVLLGSALYLLAGNPLKTLPEVVGIGTIITAFFMGPLIEFFNVHIARPFLYGKKS
ncbi:MAG: hypothetical protein IJ123_00240 [Blautia sp.]|nr:hypothetical protein [Blautia sp.]